MKRMITLTLIISCLAIASSVQAATFKMMDGSIIQGDLAERSIKLKTSYGEATFRVVDIVSYQDGVLKLRDGNTIKGIILNRSLKVRTSSGSFAVDPLKIHSYEP